MSLLLSCPSYSRDSTTTQARRSTWYDTRPGVGHANLVRCPKATTKQVTEIVNSLKDPAEAQSEPSVPQGLPLPPVHLPTFEGDPQDNLSRFLEHFKSIISTSAISPRFYVAHLKQKCESEPEHLTSCVKQSKRVRSEQSKITLKLIFPIHRKLRVQNYFEQITDELSKK